MQTITHTLSSDQTTNTILSTTHTDSVMGALTRAVKARGVAPFTAALQVCCAFVCAFYVRSSGCVQGLLSAS